MPDVTQAEIGRRMYHVHREKKVEHAVKMLQQGLGQEWRSLKEEEILVLGHVLQCTWNTIDQKVWDRIPFGTMGMETVRKILSYGDGVSPGHNPAPEAVGEIRKILLSIT
jgi:ribosomal protein L31E